MLPDEHGFPFLAFGCRWSCVRGQCRCEATGGFGLDAFSAEGKVSFQNWLRSPKSKALLTSAGFSFKKILREKFDMKYAVIRTGGKQYRVSEGTLSKSRSSWVRWATQVTLADVLFIGGNGEVKIGSPLVSNAKVTGEIVSQARAKKILVFKKKRRKEL